MIDLQRENIRVESVKSLTYEVRQIIHKIPGVNGSGITHSRVTGIGTDEHQIMVTIENDDPNVISQLPSDINGITVVYMVTGKHVALFRQQIQDLINSFKCSVQMVRPLQSEASVGSYVTRLAKSYPGDLTPTCCTITYMI